MSEERARIWRAMLEVVVEKGYAQTELAEVLERAGVEETQFKHHFASKEECAMAVLEEVVASNERATREAYESEAQWPDSLRAAAYAQAKWISENPLETRFGIVEMLWGNEMTQAVRERAFRGYIGYVDGGRAVAPDPEAVPAYTAEGVIGSITEMLTKHLQRGSPDPYHFVPELMYLAVRPYLGEAAAARELEIAPPPRAERG